MNKTLEAHILIPENHGLPQIKENEGKGDWRDAPVKIKLFNPVGIGRWYLTEYDPEEDIAFGLCCLTEAEIGYVSIKELAELSLPFGMKIERDLYWKERTIGECMDEAGLTWHRRLED